MKDKVLDFFKNLPANPKEQFNKAFDLYRNSPGNSFAQVRYFNVSGFSKPALQNILYELKKIHGISDAQIRAAIVQSKPTPANTTETFEIPQWEKGAAGNKARKAFCKEKGIGVEKFTNKVMDAAITKWAEEGKAALKEAEAAATDTPPAPPLNDLPDGADTEKKSDGEAS